MLKKVWSVLVILAVLFSQSVCLAKDNPYGVPEECRKALLTGILGEKLPENTETVTRSTFVKVVADLLRVLPVKPEAYFYADVTADTPDADYIYTARTLGWVSPAENFYPAGAITLFEAVCISIRAAQYDQIARSSGGYPAGYMVTAGNISLTNGIGGSGEEAVSYDTFLRLLFNLLNCEVPDASYSGNGATLSNNGATLLERLYDIHYVGGVVTDTVYGSLNQADSPLPEEEYGVCIDGEQYPANQSYEELLGYRIDGFYQLEDGTKTILCAAKSTQNRDVIIQAGEFEKLQNNRVIYYPEEKQKRAELSLVYDLIYNGKKVERDKEAYINDKAVLKLIDNDNDNRYDVVIADHYTYVTVKAVDLVNELVITDQQNAKYSVDLSQAENDVTVVYQTTEPNAPTSYLKDITPGELLAVKKSQGGKLVKLYRCAGQVSGTASRMDTAGGKITIDDREYSMSDYFMDIYQNALALGREYSFQLGLAGEIVSTRMDNNYTYGFLALLYKTDEGEERYKARIFNEFGKFLIADVAPRVNVDRRGMKSLDEEFFNLFCDGTSFQPQLIRYKLNQAGEVHAIDTATTQVPAVLGGQIHDDDKLTRYGVGAGNQYYYKSYGTLFYPLFNLSSATIFVVPQDASDYDSYAIGSDNLFVNDTGYTNEEILPYDVGETGGASVVVYRADMKKLGINASSKSMVVETIEEAVTEEDEPAVRICGWSNGEYVTVDVPKDVPINKKDAAPLCTGDIIRYSESNGKVKRVVVDFDASPGVFGPSGMEDQGYFNDQVYSSSLQYQFGKVYAREGGYIYIATKKDVGGNFDFSIDKLLNCMCRNPKVAVVDLDANRVIPGTLDDVMTYLNNGDNASTVVLIQTSLETKQICIYRGRENA